MNSETNFSVVGGSVEQLSEVTFEEIGFRERQDLQRWVEDYPEIVGPDLLLVTAELPERWAPVPIEMKEQGFLQGKMTWETEFSYNTVKKYLRGLELEV